MHEIKEDRRNFLSWLVGGGLLAFIGSVLYPVYKYVIPPASGEANVSQVKLPFKLKELQDDEKKSRIFKFGRNVGIILITPENDVKAFNAVCTHLDCTVQYRKDLSIIWCACHNGRYDLEGRNISGPPPRPLTEYTVHIDTATGEIFVAEANG